MSEKIQLMVVDLSHYETGTDYQSLADGGIIGVIYKATQGAGYQDPTYASAKKQALKAGLLWGSYHFGDGSNVMDQVNNYIATVQPDPSELICLDFEDNGNNTMSLDQAQQFVQMVESNLGRPNEIVLYSGNLIKEDLGERVSPYWSDRRLWLAQYGTSPSVQNSWDTYWLWQYTDGDVGPTPHTAPGIQGTCDCNSYAGPPGQLIDEWASGQADGPVPPPQPEELTVTVLIPDGVAVIVKRIGLT